MHLSCVELWLEVQHQAWHHPLIKMRPQTEAVRSQDLVDSRYVRCKH